MVKKTKPESLKTDEQNKSLNNRRVGEISLIDGKIYGKICGKCEFLAGGEVKRWLDAWFVSLQMKWLTLVAVRTLSCCCRAPIAINRHTGCCYWRCHDNSGALMTCILHTNETDWDAGACRWTPEHSHNQCNWFGHSCCSLPRRVCTATIAECFRLAFVSKHRTTCRLCSSSSSSSIFLKWPK